MYEAGVRFENGVYVAFTIDISNGNMSVMVELVDNEGDKRTATGSVTWDE